ncbi:anti-sigma factor family protein [Crateriforma conspicua]|uniref:anti-sigma factor family protein n=1 Tax=Crateriforma conspicua TaxID=2527996 RepID=UPI0011A1CE51|nr:hypothetical protein [Crateriforma conspicua]
MMSDLDPEIEERLSGYLDGAVDAQQQARIEARLRHDAGARADLEGLRDLGDRLRELSDSESSVLPDGFADRVVEAAIQRARLEGCEDSHPLLKASTQPVRTAIAVPVKRVAAVGAALALAASVAVAVVLLPDPSPVDPINGLAQTDPSGVRDVETQPENQVVVSPEMPQADPSSIQQDSMLVQADADTDDLIDSTSRETVLPRPDTVASRTQPKDAAAMTPAAADTVAPPEDAAVLDSLVGASATGRSRSTKAVLVLDIRLVDKRLGMAPIRDAMQRARVADESEQPVDPSVLGAVANAVDDANLSGSLMYLKAPAKQLDRFIMNLLADREQVESVGLSLASDAPVLGVASEFADVKPTSVRHDFGDMIDSAESSRLVDSLADRAFLPLQATLVPDAIAGLQPGGADDGPDVMSNVFILVR